jgi:hypothetical protein
MLARTTATTTRLEEAAATVVAALDEEAIEAAAAAAITTTARPRQQTIKGQLYKLTATTASTHILELAIIAISHFPTRLLKLGERGTLTRSRLRRLQALLTLPSSPTQSLTLRQHFTHSATLQ